ncbi:MAG: methyltransferase [Nitrospinae bacterium]|nr:methyltransferase [Nitrospinota bacterium]
MEHQAKSSSFYDAGWAKWELITSRSPAPAMRRRKIIAILSKQKFSSLLDVGCGTGELLRDVASLAPGAGLAGADLSPAVLEANKARYPQIRFFPLDIDREAIAEKFDVVVSSEVVEHCSDYRQAVARLAGMAARRLIITVPSGPVYPIDRMMGHTMHFTAERIGEAMAKAGLKVVKIERWGFPFFNLYKRLINMNPERVMESYSAPGKYGFRQIAMASLVAASFRLCLPFWGNQIFAIGERPDIERSER